MKPFNPNDPRCKFPKFGKAFDAAMRKHEYSNTALAALVGIDHTAVAGYRRGFSRPGDADRIDMLEKLLDTKLDMSELTPNQKHLRAVAVKEAALHPALEHLAAAALVLGFQATFKQVGE